MDFYPENYAVTITVPFTDPAGAQVTPSTASAVLLDGEGAQIVDLGALTFAVDATEHVMTITGAHNTLPTDERRTVRILEVSMTLPGGTIKRRFSYAVETEVRLAVMENSFMTYEMAEITSVDFVHVSPWLMADENKRKTALIEAYNRLTLIPMKYNPRDEEGVPIREEECVVERDLWIETTADAYVMMPTHFKRALRRAQFIETNDILQGDALARKRREGIISETIGESSVRLSESMVNYGISTETLASLAGYIHFDMRIGRA